MSTVHRCDRYEIATLPGVSFCRKGGARVVGEMMQELKSLRKMVVDAAARFDKTPIEMILHCPECGHRHIDLCEFATKVHHTHACQHCGMVWRPCVSPTVGVKFLPGFKNEGES